jgi:two-component system NtrC family sensor kinase
MKMIIRSVVYFLFLILVIGVDIHANKLFHPDTVLLDSQSNINLAKSQYKLAEYYYGVDIKSSLSYAKEALVYANKCSDETLKVKLKALIGKNYIKIGAYTEALDLLKEALLYFESVNDEKGHIETLKSIGDLFWYTRNFNQALEYYEELGNYAEKVNDTLTFIKSYISKGAVYGNINRLDTAIILFKRANELSKIINNKYVETLSKFNIGDALLHSGNPSRAIKIFYEILDMAKFDKRVYQNYAGLYNSLAEAYFYLDDYEKAEKYNKMCLRNAQEKGQSFEIRDYYSIQYKLDSAKENFDIALENHLAYKRLSDSINTNKHRENLANFKLVYDLKKRQIEIDKLKLENEISNNRLKINRYFLFSGTIVLLLLIALFINIYRSKKELNRKNIKLDEQREELTSTLDQLKHTQAQLVQSEKMASLGIFTTGIAHEINNPLNYINGGVHILEDIQNEFDPDNIHEFREKFNLALKMIKDGFNKSSNIVKSLMTFATRENKDREKHSIINLLRNTLSFLKPQLEDIAIETDCVEDDEIFVYPDKLHQVLINIFDNAIKALSGIENKKIKVLTSKSNQFFIISIHNNGPHISKENLNKLFDPFFTTRQPGEGVGMGLTISYNLIKEHKGDIKVQNLENGVEFIIELPL